MQNSILLENITREDLLREVRAIISEELNRKLQPAETPTDFLTRHEVKQLTRCSLPTIDRMTKTGVLKGYRLGRRILFKASEVESALTEIETLKYKHQ